MGEEENAAASAKAGEAIAEKEIGGRKSRNLNQTSGGKRERCEEADSPRRRDRSFKTVCANDSLLAFLHSAATDAGRRLLCDGRRRKATIQRCFPDASPGDFLCVHLILLSIRNFSLRSIYRFEGRALCVRAATEIKARDSSRGFVISNRSWAIIRISVASSNGENENFPRSIASAKTIVLARVIFLASIAWPRVLYPRL